MDFLTCSSELVFTEKKNEKKRVPSHVWEEILCALMFVELKNALNSTFIMRYSKTFTNARIKKKEVWSVLFFYTLRRAYFHRKNYVQLYQGRFIHVNITLFYKT